MELADQVLLIREFMMAVAAPVTSHSLETGTGMSENAELTLECSLQLAARYNQLHETLHSSTPQDPIEESKRQTPEPAAPICDPQTGLPARKSQLSDLRRSPEPRRPSPQPPPREPPSPYF